MSHSLPSQCILRFGKCLIWNNSDVELSLWLSDVCLCPLHAPLTEFKQSQSAQTISASTVCYNMYYTYVLPTHNSGINETPFKSCSQSMYVRFYSGY